MSKQILERFILSEEFGNGAVSDVVYNTAMVSRIRTKDKIAIPETISYIRGKQLPDGSWGTKYPVSFFDRILSTLMAILALVELNDYQDALIIEKGIKYVKENLNKIQKIDSLGDKMTIGFELIFPVLISELEKQGIKFNDQDTIEFFKKERDEKIKKIEHAEKFSNYPGVKSWQYSLEGIGAIYSEEKILRMVKDNSLICSSFGATAYAILRNPEISQKSLDKLKKSCRNGGIPSLDFVIAFDLSWSINNLIFAGFDINSPELQVHLDKLEAIWITMNGMIGAAEGLPPDADDISNTLYTLIKSKRINGNDHLGSLLKFYSNGYFMTFEAEKHPSLSTNINCLIALNQLADNDFVKGIILKVSSWTKEYLIKNNYSFNDKWHMSKYYSMSRALIAFGKIDKIFAKHIMDLIFDEQDQLTGGWGSCGQPTKLESSYNVIAILDFLKNNPDHFGQKEYSFLKKSIDFINQGIDESDFHFWIDKTLYSVVNVDRITVLCAKYAWESARIPGSFN